MVDLTLSLLARNFNVGDQFSFDVLIDGTDEVSAANVDMVYNSGIISLTGVDYFLSKFPLQVSETLGNGKLTMVRAIPQKSVSGRNIFASLSFKGIAPGVGMVDFTTDCQVFGFVSETDVLKNRIGGSFTFFDIDILPPAPLE